MARIVVLPDTPDLHEDVPPTAAYVEEVSVEHLNDEQSAVQVLERLEWAIRDASGSRRMPRRVL